MPDEQIATTVAESPAHAAWAEKPDTPPPAETPPPAPEKEPPSPLPPTPDVPVPGEQPPGAPSGKPGTIADATRAYLSKKPPGPPAAPTPAAAAGLAAASAATAAGATPAEAQAAGEQAVKDYLEAIGPDGKPFQIPLGVKIPIKVNGRAVQVPIGDVPKGLMFEKDYQHNRQRDADARRALNAEATRIEALKQQLEDDRKQMEAAQRDPDQWRLYEEHLLALRTNPIYAENWERGRAARIDAAELNAYRGAEASELERSAANEVLAAIERVGAEYPGANPELVRQQYAQALQTGQAELTEASIRQFFAAEVQRAEAYVAPIRQELTGFKAELERLKKENATAAAAAAHNASTRRALERDSQGRFTAPAGGSAPDVTRESSPTPFTSHELEARKRAWVNKR